MFKRLDKILLASTTLLFVIGIIMIFSASSIMSIFAEGNILNFVTKQIVMVIAGGFLSLFILKVPTRKYYKYATLGMFLIFAALIYLFMFGQPINDRKSWLVFKLGKRFTLQVSEFAKVVLIMFTASFYGKYKEDIKQENIKKIFFPVVLAASIVVLIIFQPDYGTAIITFFIFAFMYFLTPINKNIKGYLNGFGVLLLIFLLTIFAVNGVENTIGESKAARLDYKYPCTPEKFEHYGNQLCNGYIAINNGGLFGVGLGQSTQKHLYLPEPHNDFIITIILEELGIIKTFFIFVLYFITVFRIFIIAGRSKTLQNQLLANGVASLIIIHIIINLSGVFGLLPMTGIPLPFLSYGGSFALALIIALTLVQRINIENESRVAVVTKRKK